jgi:hypothetical protein
MAQENSKINAEKLFELAERFEDVANRVKDIAEEMKLRKIEEIEFKCIKVLSPNRLPADLRRIIESAMDGLNEARWPSTSPPPPKKGEIPVTIGNDSVTVSEDRCRKSRKKISKDVNR